MTVHVDKVADAAYIRLVEGIVFESEEVGRGVVLDWSEEGKLLAIELLEVSKNIPGAAFSSIDIQTA